MRNETLEEAARKLLDKTTAEENFKKWFGKSILKHDDGRPMEFYHGTDKDFHTYDYSHVGKGNDSYGSGFYFTNKPDVAHGYAYGKDEPDTPNIHKVHLRLEKPIDPEDETPFKREHIQKMIQAAPDHMDSLSNYGDVSYSGYHRVLRDATDAFAELPKFHAMNALNNDFYSGHEGEFLKNLKTITKHDGVIIKTPETGHVVVNIFHPNQIKSAIGNTGAYSRRKDNITESTLSPRDEIDQFRHKWNEKGVQNFAYAHNNGTISLSQLIVPKEARNQGVGSMFMKELTDIADKHGHKITLTPSSDFGGTKSRLVSFYKKHGFVENKGKNKDFQISDSMYREPKLINESEEDWLHVEHRKEMTPLEHVRDIISNHQKLGWQLTDDQRVLTEPLTSNLSGGVYRSVKMNNPEGNQSVLNIKFRYGNNRKQTEYKIKRTQLTE